MGWPSSTGTKDSRDSRDSPRGAMPRPRATRRTWAWCSSVTEIARSACRSAASEASGVSASERPSASVMNSCASCASAKEPASQALHTTPPAAPEKPTRCSCEPQLAHAPSWGASPAASSSLSRKRERSRPRRGGGRGAARGPGPLVQEGELAAQQVKDRRVGLGGLEQAPHGVARARGAIECLCVAPQPRVGIDGVGAGHRQQLPAALVELQLQAEERLQTSPEPASGPPHALGDRAQPAPMEGVHVQDAVGLPVSHRAQHHRLGLQLSWHILGESRSRAGAPAGALMG